MIRHNETSNLLPSTWAAFFKKRAIELGGLIISLIGIGFILSLATYSPADPSMNTAGGGQAHNLLGASGSYVADILLQILGLSAFFLGFVLMIWGGRIMRHQSIQYIPLRLVGLACILVLGTVALTPFSFLDTLYTPGGILGLLLTEPLVYMGKMFYIPGWTWALLAGALAFTLFTLTTSIRWSTWGLIILFPLRLVGALLRRSPKPVDLYDYDEELPAVRTPRKMKLMDEPEEPRMDILPSSKHRGGYRFPSLDFLRKPEHQKNTMTKDKIQHNIQQLGEVLTDFGVKGVVDEGRPGPVVTLYELKPAPGTKSSRVVGLSDDIARSMSALSARIAVVPGQNLIGIELPNDHRQVVYLRELFAHESYTRTKCALPLALGKDIAGEPVVADLARMPHLLVAGTTGSGKSVSINTMILSLLYALTPEQCRFIMVDPKMLELSVYDGIPHLLTPVVTDPRKAVVALKWAVREMEIRYQKMSRLGVRNIDGYNQRVREAAAKGETLARSVQTGFDKETGAPQFEEQSIEAETLPYIVIIVDEMADLMLVAGKEIESAVQRLAQMARAAGLHLIMATQRPSVDVITGTIKANFPTRISFQVTSKIDSRTILGEQGAEQLLGQGDMLYMMPGGRTTRLHGPFVHDREVEHIVQFLKTQGEPTYVTEVLVDEESADDSGSDMDDGSNDPLYQQALELVLAEGKASTSFIQRHMKIGYNRAARLMDIMEANGVVSPANHVGKREILIGS